MFSENVPSKRLRRSKTLSINTVQTFVLKLYIKLHSLIMICFVQKNSADQKINILLKNIFVSSIQLLRVRALSKYVERCTHDQKLKLIF